ncbi:MAG: DoxX family protein [Deltaproteobacteria bacterium]|nr:DoxX family protein [Deltaproteobacteria bacterium]MBI3386873.1 DoxX family protein [Deltaproteobacteria bacterium]
MSYLVLAGRILFAAIFIAAAPRHFTGEGIAHAAELGVPLAGLLVPVSGVMSALGGVSILVGYQTRIGAWLLVAFLVPVTAMMHAFWTVKEPLLIHTQQAMFMKNLALLGAALLIAYFGAGPASLDNR